MSWEDLATVLGAPIARALEKKGFTELTSVQRAVLDEAFAGRDLRVTSQTGSGKTVAIGLALRDVVAGDSASSKGGVARPLALVVAPTRELARQVEDELTWLYAELGVRVAATTGGASYRDERRALALGPGVVVGTPGRLLDHLTRGGIDASQVGAVVLDEADRMLDLGFREDLRAILGHTPEGRRTHLVSATFPRDVRALADSVQKDAAHVEGTRLGAAHGDIEHHVYLVDPAQRVDAIVNLLLARPDALTLVFARTRADVAKLAKDLAHAGFGVGSLSGEMEQTARTRALAAFRRGDLRVLVATDVAARGIDVQDIAHVIHAELSSDPDSYTHRSGRTGRAGRKGTSSLLVTPAGLRQTTDLLRRAGIAFEMAQVPSAAEIREAADSALYEELSSEVDAEGAPVPDDRAWALAKRLSASAEGPRALARLIARLRRRGEGEPRDVRRVAAPPARPGPRERPRPTLPARAAPAERTGNPGEWIAFRVSWGADHGADARRLLALVCRRGDIRGNDIGAIHITPTWSIVNVRGSVADAFAEAAGAPDRRDPRVRISRDRRPYDRRDELSPRHEGGRSNVGRTSPRPALGSKRRH